MVSSNAMIINNTFYQVFLFHLILIIYSYVVKWLQLLQFIICPQENGFKYRYLIRIILLDINYLCSFYEIVPSTAI